MPLATPYIPNAVRPIAGNSVQGNQYAQAAQSGAPSDMPNATSANGIYYATNPQNPDEQIIYNPQTKQYATSDPYTGQFGGWQTSLQAAQSTFSSKYGNPGKSTNTTPSGTPNQTSPQQNAAAATAGNANISAFTPSASQINSLAPSEASVASQKAVGYNPTSAASTGYSAAQMTPSAYQAALAKYTGMGSGAQVDPNSAYNSVGTAANLEAQSLAPTFQQEIAASNAQNAAAGIFNSGAATYNTNQLRAQQGATLAGQDAQFVSQGQNAYNQDILANQASSNTASEFNANAYNTNQYDNQAAINAASQYNAGNQQQASAANQAATNQASQYDATNQFNTNQFNANNYNTANQYNASAQNAVNALNTEAANTANNNYANAYNQYYGNVENQAYNTGNEVLGSYLNAFGNPGAASLYGQEGSAASNAYNSGSQQQAQANGSFFSSLGSLGGIAATAFGA